MTLLYGILRYNMYKQVLKIISCYSHRYSLTQVDAVDFISRKLPYNFISRAVRSVRRCQP